MSQGNKDALTLLSVVQTASLLKSLAVLHLVLTAVGQRGGGGGGPRDCELKSQQGKVISLNKIIDIDFFLLSTKSKSRIMQENMYTNQRNKFCW